VELELSGEQEVLLEATRRFIATECPITKVRELADHPAGFDPAWWERGAALGWTSMLVPPALGGGSISAHGLLDLVLVAEEMGRMVTPGPLVPVNVVASALGAGGTPDQQASVLAGLVEGTAVAAWCGVAPVDAAPVAGGGWTLTGEAAPVEAAGQAAHLLVAATDGQGLTQFLVPTATPGVVIRPMDGLDLVRRHAHVRFDAVEVPPAAVVGTAGTAAEDLERQLQVAVVLQCSELVGIAGRVFEMTVDYLGDRYSFGRPLASYQALKHRVADLKLWLEACLATAAAAARAVAAGDPAAAELASAAKATIGPHVTELVQDCVQLHGGIGVTWEHDLHLYLRRATVDRLTHGTPEDHRERVAAVLLDPVGTTP
jgi:alkylation response protein AidB-like acyl-CoA dehydrogenase